MDIRGNKKNSYYSADSKRMNKENKELLLNGADILVTASASKAEVLDAFFSRVFTNKASQASGKTRQCSQWKATTSSG